MAKKIFIWVANPKANSLCGAIADRYQESAIKGGADVRRMNLSDMKFSTNFDGYGEDAPPLEEDLLAWQDSMLWADHVMFVYPYWWGAMPTLAKAVLDRALTPGFAYKYHSHKVSWDKLLSGRTGDAIITSDTPSWIDTLIYRKPGRRVIKNQVYAFCGIKPKNIVQYGSVKMAKELKIQKWLNKSAKLGLKAAA